MIPVDSPYTETEQVVVQSREQIAELPVKPVYSQDSPNDPIILPSSLASLRFDDQQRTVTVAATIEFAPKPKLLFRVSDYPPENNDATCAIEAKNKTGEMVFLTRGVSTKVLFVRSSFLDEDEIWASEKSGFIATAATSEIVSATFHIFNFPLTRGKEDPVLSLESAVLINRLEIQTDGWNVLVTSLRESIDREISLHKTGGYAITHVGRIMRSDGRPFSSDSLAGLINALRYFFSFALGRWVGIALPVGFNAGGEIVFEEWGAPSMQAGCWKGGNLSWFDVHNPELLAQVFPGFWKRWQDPLWHETMVAVIYYYLAALDTAETGIRLDVGMIVGQAALERLAWTYCVKDRQMVSAEAFGHRGLRAADKLRLLLSSLGIPSGNAKSLKILQTGWKRNWDDCPHAIVGIRNGFVHPDSKGVVSQESAMEGWKLTLWYLDLILLRLCEFNGSYGCRLATRKEGQVEPVPWASSGTAK